MPNRIIKESINESRGLSECSVAAQDFFKRLITYADDYGRFNADVEIMRARLYPRELSIITECDIDEWLLELIGVGKVMFYTSEPRKLIYGCFPNWQEHQRIRESKGKIPAPADTKVNDWYFRRFVPLAMKAEIIERDNFKCRLCGKYLTSCTDGKAYAKLASGTFHIDHIVPVEQGGRATVENLRLTCPSCNQGRKKRFCSDEIIQLAFNPGIHQESAAVGGELPQVAARVRANPIQSNPNPNPNPNPTRGRASAAKPLDPLFDQFWSAYPKKVAKEAARKAFDKLKPDDDLLGAMLKAIEQHKRSDQWAKDGGQFIPNPTTWLNQKRWEDEVTQAFTGGKKVGFQAYDPGTDTDYQGIDLLAEARDGT